MWFPNLKKEHKLERGETWCFSSCTSGNRNDIPTSRQENERGTLKKQTGGGFPGGAVVENLPANAGDTGSSPGLGGSHMPRSN